MSLRERLRGLKIYKIIEDIILYFYKYSLVLCKEYIPKISCNNTTIKRIWQCIFFPYILLKGIICVLLEYSIFRIINVNKLSKEKNRLFEYDFAIVAIVKNESNYLREWVAYHRVACEDNVHFFIYDNGSNDNTRATVEDYIEQGYITYIDFGGNEKQLPAYNDAIKRYGNIVRYMAFIDVDEFIVVQSGENLTKHICNILKNNYAAGLGINWIIFGSSGYKERQAGIVTETFLRHGSKSHWGNTHIKTICNPRFTKRMISPHYALYKLGVWNISPNGKRQDLWWNKEVDWSDMSIHHYFCKSEEEYSIKKGRGFADKLGGKYDDKRFIQYDLNDYYDDTMLLYTKKIKNIMRMN